jgi:hypothetical protein
VEQSGAVSPCAYFGLRIEEPRNGVQSSAWPQNAHCDTHYGVRLPSYMTLHPIMPFPRVAKLLLFIPFILGAFAELAPEDVSSSAASSDGRWFEFFLRLFGCVVFQLGGHTSVCDLVVDSSPNRNRQNYPPNLALLIHAFLDSHPIGYIWCISVNKSQECPSRPRWPECCSRLCARLGCSIQKSQSKGSFRILYLKYLFA